MLNFEPRFLLYVKGVDDMYIKIKMIQVMDRIRKETGDLKPLIDSIREHGLINPITVMHTLEGYVLIAGYRRLQAVKALGEHDIVATVLDPKDADEQLKMEIDENEVRKDFTIREKLAYAEKNQSDRAGQVPSADERPCSRRSRSETGVSQRRHP